MEEREQVSSSCVAMAAEIQRLWSDGTPIMYCRNTTTITDQSCSMMYYRSGFDCKILMIVNCKLKLELAIKRITKCL